MKIRLPRKEKKKQRDDLPFILSGEYEYFTYDGRQTKRQIEQSQRDREAYLASIRCR